MEPRETSGATTTLLVGFVRQQGGDEAVQRVLERAGVTQTAAELEDMSRWVSYDTRIRLMQAATDVLGDPSTCFKVGATSLTIGLNHSLVLLVRTLGSPKQVYRQIPAQVGKFSTTSTMELVEAGDTHAVIRFRLHDEYEHSRLDCAYAQGLLSVVPEVFGLPAARIVHDDCQSDGHDACMYYVTWAKRSRFSWLRRGGKAVDAELVALRGQLEALQSAASDLVDSDGLDAILARITERAGAAVVAPSYLLAVRTPSGQRVVHSAGVPDDQVEKVAATLLAGGSPPRSVVVDVESSRHWHGRLAAIYSAEHKAQAVEKSLLAAYARHAAAAIDLLIALEDSRRDERRAKALLSLAHQLAGARDPIEVAEVVSASVPDVVDSDSNTVMLWEPGAGVLRTAACAGQTPENRQRLLSTPVSVEHTPELTTLLGKREPMVLHTESATGFLGEFLRALGVANVVVVPLVTGEELYGVVTASWREDIDGHVVDALHRLQGVADQAATALRNTQLLSKVRHQSEHDALTGLPNRVLFADSLDDALRHSAPEAGVAVLFCDLDRFKQVNDSSGHAAGDELLRQVAARLRGVLRPTDTVGRLSGDEFAILLTNVADTAVASDLARRVIGCFSEPFRIDGHETRVTASVGVAVHFGADGRGDRLLRAADGAMYEAKQRGRNQIATAGTMRQSGAARPSLEAELAEAVTGDQLRLFFQPVVEARVDGSDAVAMARLDQALPGAEGLAVVGGLDLLAADLDEPSAQSAARAGVRVVGAEALVRWQHPRLGLIGPAAFLPLAEESGLVVDLDLWALGAACEALDGWDDGSDGVPLHVAVNLAAPTLLDPRLPGAVRTALHRHGIAPHRLHLEVVESRTLANLPGVVERLVELRQLGVRVSLDDFGTGYSTLAWLQQLPVDQIKIDRTFIAALPDDGASMAVVRGVLALARELGLQVVAEGVEDERQLEALREAGCDLMQGYLLGKPKPGSPHVLDRVDAPVA